MTTARANVVPLSCLSGEEIYQLMVSMAQLADRLQTAGREAEAEVVLEVWRQYKAERVRREFCGLD